MPKPEADKSTYLVSQKALLCAMHISVFLGESAADWLSDVEAVDVISGMDALRRFAYRVRKEGNDGDKTN